VELFFMLSSRVTSIPGFLGRKSELAWLLNLFEEATGGAPDAKPGGPRMALVLAESGYGKSRLVQALYQALSTDQTWDPPEINYWPDSFRELEGQLRVNPDMAGHDPLGPPRFMWLGMRWHPSNVRNVEERVCQLPEARSALQAHVETARAKEGIWRSMLRKSSAVLARQAADEVVGQLVDTFLPFGGLIRKAVDSVREISRHHGELGLNVRERSDAKAIDAGEEMLDNLREVFRGPSPLSLVLWLDDAQWIDTLSLEFLRRLWLEATQKGWPLLVVVTHWKERGFGPNAGCGGR
jgi:predicted ATPase